ncbi:hypothetical protein F5984_16285 [Rudanella paleaurantiibacter]|uniref:LPS export ABC transporter periplasmic protein LptC n=1 Tax=Rudanella paleaurantiibacter TaxID=2614655 RepID=A0A7J5TZ67_9BACT|nr:hypothetical protein [Rudanella paleaurantiibacter]KAB7729196.1 hypothetical protein F5984_16285 [Rudanella paleaurantiibacter]
MKFLVCLLLSFVFLGCENASSKLPTEPVYYDVAGYVSGQIEKLTAQKPTVEKSTFISGQTNLQTTAQIDWAKELELFKQADINKPAFRTSYTITRPDSLTYEYKLKSTEDKLTVRSLRVQLDSVTRQPIQIQAVLKTENPLYMSERHLVLISGSQPRQGWGVHSYQIEGFQQLTYFDRNNFRVNGHISR